MRLAEQFDIIQISVRHGRAVEELICNADPVEGNPRVPQAVSRFTADHFLDGVPPKRAIVGTAALALNQYADMTGDGDDINAVIVLGRTIDRLVPLPLPNGGDQTLEMVPFHLEDITERNGDRERRIVSIRDHLFDGKIAGPDIARSVQHIARQRPFGCQELIELHIKCRKIIGMDDRAIDAYFSRLTDPVSPIGRLILLGGIPGPRVVDDVVCLLNVDPEADRDRRQDNDAEARLGLKCLDALLTAGDVLRRGRRVAIDDIGRESKHLLNVIAQHPLNFSELAKDDDFLAFCPDTIKLG